MERRLQIGIVKFVNSIPLSYGMDAYGDLVLDTPRSLAARFASGELDLSFVPSVFFLRRRDLCHLVPGVSISSRGPTTSVLLCATRPIHEVASIRMSGDSMTSNVLAATILREKYGLTPRFVPPDSGRPVDGPADGSQAAEAWMVIGDAALKPQPAAYCIDLGTEWLALTGLPVVYAVCVARTPQLARGFASIMCRNTEHNLDELDYILGRVGKLEHAPYLRGLDYGLADDHLRSLAAFDAFLRKMPRGSLPGLDAAEAPT